MPQLAVVFFDNQLQEPVEQSFAFIRCHIIDALDVVANGKEALPASDGVGANDRVDGAQRSANVVGGPARLGI